MKISGKDPSTLSTEHLLVLPRGEENLDIRAKGLKDMEEFEVLCPAPNAPVKLVKGGKTVPDMENVGYQATLAEWHQRRLAWMVIKSLQDFEWDTVNLDDPSSWKNWEKDLKDAGFTQIECNRVLQLVLEANTLSEALLTEARLAFLRGQAAA
jgi:hypothetical protein